ncbi:hypothetical protein PMAYCL1PPCAC_03530, partial [Pristionchus mayeri]
HMQLNLKLNKQQLSERWEEGGAKAHLTGKFFGNECVTALINLLGKSRLQTLEVILSALSLPTDRFAASFFSAIEQSKYKDKAGQVFHAVCRDLNRRPLPQQASHSNRQKALLQ